MYVEMAFVFRLLHALLILFTLFKEGDQMMTNVINSQKTYSQYRLYLFIETIQILFCVELHVS